MEIAIRSAAAADLDVLSRLLGVLFSIEVDFEPAPERQRRGLLAMLEEPERRCVLVAHRDGAVMGMVTAQLLVSTAEGGISSLVEDLVVDQAERRRGVGRRLLQAVETWSRERGATRIQLLADRGNTPALRFYDRMGWRSTQLVCLRRILSDS